MNDGTPPRDLCQGALERDEHAAQVLAMRRLGGIALIAWPLFGLVDWFVVSCVHPGRFWVYLLVRAVGLFLLGGAVWRLFSQPRVSPRMLRAIDVGVFASISALVSVTCLEYRGIETLVGLQTGFRKDQFSQVSGLPNCKHGGLISHREFLFRTAQRGRSDPVAGRQFTVASRQLTARVRIS